MTNGDKTMAKVDQVKELPFILRAIWFFLLGWELTAIWIGVAWALNATIIGLPLGLWMIDRVPQVLTLKAQKGVYVGDGTEDGPRKFVAAEQLPFVLRAIYFVVIGWWFSLIWAFAGWALCLTIIGLPLGLIMLNRLPAATTLQR